MTTTRGARQSQPVVAQTPNIKKKTSGPDQPKLWEPARFLSDEESPEPSHDYVLVILNQPIENVDLFLRLCSQGQLVFTVEAGLELIRASALAIVCADGGANRVKDLNLSEDKEDEEYCVCHRRPVFETLLLTLMQSIDIICGDLDSLRPEVKQYYEDSGTLIIEDPDQYSTDFTKCLKHLSDAATTQSKHGDKEPEFTLIDLGKGGTFDIAVLGGFGGRADQAFSQMHHLYSASEDKAKYFNDIYLITTESIVFLLHQGLNRIPTPVAPDLFGECIGIIPVAKPSIITTRGLEWDVEKWPTEFGKQISTSNHIKASHIEIETSEKVLFTLEIARKLEQEAGTHRTKRQKINHNVDQATSAAEAIEAATPSTTGIDNTSTSSHDQSNGPPPLTLSANIVKKLGSIDDNIGRIVTLLEKSNDRCYNNTEKHLNQTTLALEAITQLLTKAAKDGKDSRTELAGMSSETLPP